MVRAGGGISYSKLSYDLFAALGNLVGTRVTPTAADLFVTQKPKRRLWAVRFGRGRDGLYESVGHCLLDCHTADW